MDLLVIELKRVDESHMPVCLEETNCTFDTCVISGRYAQRIKVQVFQWVIIVGVKFPLILLLKNILFDYFVQHDSSLKLIDMIGLQFFQVAQRNHVLRTVLGVDFIVSRHSRKLEINVILWIIEEGRTEDIRVQTCSLLAQI